MSDFGSARRDLRLANGSIKLLTTVIGTPEMSESPYNAFLTDTYSMGVILYQLSHSGEFRFNLVQNCPQNRKRRRKEVRELAAMKRRPETIKYSDSISKELKQLLQRMLEPDPNRRINLNDILTVEWMEKKKIPSN